MNQLNSVVNGFLFGVGLILASALMKSVLHMGVCQMKPKENLAEKLLNEDTDSLMSAFIKGFEKAREMALQVYLEGVEKRKTVQHISNGLNCLGEEEVKE